MKKRILLITMIGMNLGIYSQTTYNENESIVNLPRGIIYQLGPGSNNTKNWTYPYSTKLTINGGVARNFEMSTIAKDNDGFMLRQFSQNTNNWTKWQKIILDDGNGNVGIGTTNASNKLHVSGSSGIRVSGEGINQIFIEGVRIGSGTNFRLYDNNNNIYYDSKTNMTFRANQLGGSGGSINLTGGNVGIGTYNPGSWELAVNGKIRAKEIKVETGWSDFVFEDEYKLPTLKEVENHIKEKGHLKDIPSAKEVEKNGIFLGEMDAKLLQKIEELTLYTIAQEKKINNLEKDNKSLKTMNSKLLELQKRLEKLENK